MPTRERRAQSMGIPVDQLPDGRGKGRKPNGSEHYRWNDRRMLSEHGYVKVRVAKFLHTLPDENGWAVGPSRVKFNKYGQLEEGPLWATQDDTDRWARSFLQKTSVAKAVQEKA